MNDTMNTAPTEVAGMDLSALNTTTLSNKGFDVHIFNPKTQKDTGITITVLGQDSDEYKKVQRAQAARSLHAALNTGPKREQKMVDAAEDNVAEMLAATTAGWTGCNLNGKEFPFNRANALHLYENYPLVRDQVLEAQRDRANFLNA